MNLQSILAKAAPWLAAAAAGPAGLAGMAIKTVAEALGSNSESADDLAQAVAGATPEQLKALKLAEIDFKVRMQELGFKQITDLEAIAAADRKDARAMQVANKSPMPAILTCGAVVMFAATLATMFLMPVPDTNRDLVVYMVGQLSGIVAACVAFWVGTTRSSENKTNLIAQSGK